MTAIRVLMLLVFAIFLVPASALGADCELRVYSNLGDVGSPDLEWWQQMLDDFGAANGCTAEYVRVDWGGPMYEKYLTEFAAGMAPDVVLLDTRWLANLAAQGLVLPLDSYIAKDAAFAWTDYFEPVRNILTSNGKVWGVPDSGDWKLFLYNNDTLGNAGMSAPPDAWTWEDYLSMSRKMTRPEGERPQYGSNWVQWEPVVHAYGQTIFDPVKKTFGLNNAAAIDALQWVYDVNNKSGVVPTYEQRGSTNWNNAFARQTIGFYSIGSWYLRFYDLPFDLGIALPPSGPAGKATHQNLAAWFVSSSSNNPDQAWKLVSYINSRSNLKTRYEKFADTPTRRSVAGESSLALWQFFTPQQREYVIRTAEFGRLYPFSEYTIDVINALGTGLRDAENGEKSARVAVEEVTSVIEAILAK